MGIVDYKARNKLLHERISKSAEISPGSKEALKRFLNAYDVSSAREGIFLANIYRFLINIGDINKEMHHSEAINSAFKKLKSEGYISRTGKKKRYGDATIDTIKNVSIRLCTWLNNGKRPEGFKDIKRNGKDQERKLKPDDMISWEEGLKIADQTNSIQMKALFLTQLDCGFRPSELIGLKYGDVKVDGDIVIFHVIGGKTGERDVWMQRAVPQFLRWYSSHPTKKKKDGLWMLESVKRSHRSSGVYTPIDSSYSYKAILSRTDLMFEKAGITDKPRDFYNLRHSSCVLDKMDNVPLDLASERHGHSVKYFVNTYGRLDLKGKLSRVRSHYGKDDGDKREPVKNVVCERCKAVNEPGLDYCKDCGSPLSPSASAKMYDEKRSADDRLNQMEAMLGSLLDANPKIKKTVEIYKDLKKKGKK